MKSDIELIVGNDIIPLRLGKDPDTGLRKFQCTDSEFGSPMFTSGSPSEAHIPYLTESNVIQTSWHGGAGQRYNNPQVSRYSDSNGIDASIAGKLLRGPKIVHCTMDTGHTLAGTGLKAVTYKGYLVIAWGQKLYKWITGDKLDEYVDCSAEITDIIVWSDYILIAHGFSTAYKYYDGTTLTTSTSNIYARQWGVVNERVWASVSNYEVVSTMSPLNNGNWASLTTIGNSDTVITCILTHKDSVFVGTTNALHQLYNDGRSSQIDRSFAMHTGAATCKGMIENNGFIYIPTATGGVYEYDKADQIINRISPAIFFGEVAAHTGKILALCGNTSFLYVVISNGTAIDILRGRWEMVNQVSTWVWHPVGTITGLTDSSDNCSHIMMTNLAGSLRLWIVCSNATDGVYYMHVPLIYENPVADTAYKFNASATWYSSVIRGNTPDSIKKFYMASMRMSKVSSTYPLALYYRVVENGTWVLLNTCTAGVYISVPLPQNTYGRQIEFKIVMASNTDSDSCELLSLGCYYAEYSADPNANQRFSVNRRYEFRVYGSANTFWEHADYAHTHKGFYCVSVHSFGATDTNRIKVNYKLDGDPFWRSLDTYVTESPWQTIQFPENTIGKIILVDFDRDDETATEILTYVIDGKLMPDKQKQFAFTAYLADISFSPSGSMMVGNTARTLAKLRDADNRKWPVRLKTFAGHDLPITIDTMHELVVESEKNKTLGYWITINATEAKGVA